MVGQVLDRYTLKEFAGPFFACLAGFTVMLLSSIVFELTDLIVARQMPFPTVLQLLIYKLPMILVLALPVAVLFGILLSLGRLAKDSELTVMRVTGRSFPRIALPLFLAAAVVSAATFYLNETVVPAANHKAENLYRQAVFRDAIPQLDANVFLQGPQGRTIYVGEVERAKRLLKHIMIFEQAEGAAGSPYPALLTAKRGTYAEGIWRLEDGVRLTFDADGYVREEVAFSVLEVTMAQGEEELLGEQKTTSEMTRKELADTIKLFQKSGANMDPFVVEYHLKLAIPLAALIWSFAAAPLAIPAARSGRFYGVVASIAVAFIYYVAMALCRSLGGNGVMPPVLAAWLPTLVFGILGLVLLARADHI
ncbi:MAG TPA: YjgP/YjgQ family permease [Firmicutes bacterium]|nr:YjgP/YjgQ family permease [Bacillota bacterium]